MEIKTLNEQIERLRELIRKCYATVAGKNGTVPEVGERNMENLPAAIASTHDTLEELTITANGTYTPQEGVDGFSEVVAEFDTSSLPKVKVNAINFNNNCLDNDRNWIGKNIDVTNVTSLYEFGIAPDAKKVDLTGWNTSNVVTFNRLFYTLGSNTTDGTTIIGIEDFDASKVDNMYNALTKMKISHPLDFRKWDFSNVKDANYILTYSSCPSVNLEGADFSGLTSGGIFFYQANIPKINIAYTKHSGVRIYGMCSNNATTLVGDYTIDDVISKDIYIFKGSGVNVSINEYIDIKTLNRASIRAVINGLEDLTGQTPQTLKIGAALLAKLTNEDIAVATNKNWTIV